MKTQEAISEMIDCEEVSVSAVASIIAAINAKVRIVDDDGEPEALNEGSESLWVVSTHELMVDGEAVAEWTRCSVGHWKDGFWDVEEDTEGGDVLPKRIEAILSELGLEDYIPSIPD
jgi:hypothetical protein